jgi:predicted enzyme related to lactoylglutathione lyase
MDHTIVHFEIPADDVEKLRTFYAELFGWKIEKMPGFEEYWNVETVPVDEQGILVRPGVNGGMMKRQTPGQKPVTYISVESIDAYSKKVVELGGTITVPKQEIPGIGWWAFAQDPEGNHFGMLQG